MRGAGTWRLLRQPLPVVPGREADHIQLGLQRQPMAAASEEDLAVEWGDLDGAGLTAKQVRPFHRRQAIDGGGRHALHARAAAAGSPGCVS